MFILQTIGVVCVAVLCLAEPPANQYLPPNKGYNYPRPTVTFPPGPPPPTYGPPAPPPSYGPPAPPPSYGPPAPPPSYGPPAPPPSYGPPQHIPYPSPPSPPPSYGPPTGPGPRPPTGPSPPYPPSHVGSPSGNNPGYGPNDHLNQAHVPGMPFDFNYAVKDDYYGTDYSHNAVSDGDVVRGEYRVQLPDGRLQIVKYTADWATGFHADVSYEGQAQYPQGSPSAPYPSPVKPNQPYGPPPVSGPY